MIDKEESEARDFLPSFFKAISSEDVNIYLEKGYGEKLGFKEQDYYDAYPRLYFVERKEVFEKQLVVVIRSPEISSLQWMKPGSGLMSMLHYETRPKYMKYLKDNKIRAFSFDGIVNDDRQRLVVSYELTAFAGVDTAFQVFDEYINKNSWDPNKSMKITILGLGNLGIQAGKFGHERFNALGLEEKGVQGISIEYLEKEITAYHEIVSGIFETTDLLIDATRRPDPTKIIISNDLLSSLPSHAVILDLSADPYEKRANDTQVKAIEGIPHGTLDKFIFHQAESDWVANIPNGISTINKRTTISCNAWPGVKAKECMIEYGEKLRPFINIVLEKGFSLDDASENEYERALYRSTIDYTEKQLTKSEG